MFKEMLPGESYVEFGKIFNLFCIKRRVKECEIFSQNTTEENKYLIHNVTYYLKTKCIYCITALSLKSFCLDFTILLLRSRSLSGLVGSFILQQHYIFRLLEVPGNLVTLLKETKSEKKGPRYVDLVILHFEFKIETK